jgi:hypothetical protein
MKREHIVVMAAAVSLSFGSGVVAVAVGAGAAQAMPNSSGSDFIYPKGVCNQRGLCQSVVPRHAAAMRLRLHRSPAVSQLGHECLPRLHGRI